MSWILNSILKRHKNVANQAFDLARSALSGSQAIARLYHDDHQEGDTSIDSGAGTGSGGIMRDPLQTYKNEHIQRYLEGASRNTNNWAIKIKINRSNLPNDLKNSYVGQAGNIIVKDNCILYRPNSFLSSKSAQFRDVERILSKISLSSTEGVECSSAASPNLRNYVQTWFGKKPELKPSTAARPDVESYLNYGLGR